MLLKLFVRILILSIWILSINSILYLLLQLGTSDTEGEGMYTYLLLRFILKSYSIQFIIIPFSWPISIITFLTYIIYEYFQFQEDKSVKNEITFDIIEELRVLATSVLLAFLFVIPLIWVFMLISEIVIQILLLIPIRTLTDHLSYLKYDISVHLDITNHWGFLTFLYVIITFIILFFFSQISNIPNESKFRLIRRLNQETKIASTLLAIYVIFLTICIHLWWMIPITLIWFGYASSLEDKFALVYPSFLLVLSSLLLVLLFYKIRKRKKEVQYIELRDKIKKEILDDLDSNQSIK